MFADILSTVRWEISKNKAKGSWVFFSIFCFLLYFYSFPRLLYYIFPFLPFNNLYIMYVCGTYTVHMSSYLSINLFYGIIYKLKHPYFESFKINPAPWPWESPDFNQTLKKVLKVALINQIFTLPLSLILFGLGAKYDHSLRLPSYSEEIVQILFFVVCEDFAFYFSHRLLHQGYLYKRIHKKHHEFNVTISLAAEYAHPIEYALGNSLPVGLGPLLYGQSMVHLITWFTWVFYRTMNTAEGHSGYNIPWAPFRIVPFSSTSSFHDFHHLKNQGNYGSFFVIWDTLLGTHRPYMGQLKENLKKVE